MTRRRRPFTTQPSTAPGGPPQVLRASSIADLIGTVPALLGFHPRLSLVAISLHGKRIGFRLRLDLPPLEHLEIAAQQVADPLIRQEPDAVLLLAYVEPGTDTEVADRLVLRVCELLAIEDVEVRDAVRCDGRRYWSYICADPRCCPDEGTPYSLDGSTMMAEAVFRGIEILPDRETLERRFDPPTGARAAELVAAAEDALAEILGAHGIDSHRADLTRGSSLQQHPELLRAGVRAVEAEIERWRGLGAGEPPELSDRQAARLSAWCALTVVRDYAWACVTRETASDQVRLWTEVVRRTVPPFEPAVLSLAGFAAWLHGDGAQAQCALDRALEADPDYQMARLLRTALSACLDPTTWGAIDPADVLSELPDVSSAGGG